MFPFGPAGSPDELLEVPGCPVCLALPQIETELVGWFALQALHDPDSRRRVLAARGLCPRHWRLVAAEEQHRRQSMLGTAELFAAVLSRQGTHEETAVNCPVCADLAASARHRLYLLLVDLGQERLDAAPATWRPCLPHLRGLGELRLERWLQRWAHEREERILAEAVAAARRYVRTRQQRYHAEATGTEAQDLVDAMAALLGDGPPAAQPDDRAVP